MLYRTAYHAASFSSLHIYGYIGLVLTEYFCYYICVGAAAEGGSSEYGMDLLIITMTVHIGSMISDYFWFVFLVVRVCAQDLRKIFHYLSMGILQI